LFPQSTDNAYQQPAALLDGNIDESPPHFLSRFASCFVAPFVIIMQMVHQRFAVPVEHAYCVAPDEEILSVNTSTTEDLCIPVQCTSPDSSFIEEEEAVISAHSCVQSSNEDPEAQLIIPMLVTHEDENP